MASMTLTRFFLYFKLIFMISLSKGPRFAFGTQLEDARTSHKKWQLGAISSAAQVLCIHMVLHATVSCNAFRLTLYAFNLYILQTLHTMLGIMILDFCFLIPP